MEHSIIEISPSDIITDILIFALISVSTIIGAYIRKRYKLNAENQKTYNDSQNQKLKKIQDCLDTQNNRGIRQSKGLIDLAEHTDALTELHHFDKKIQPIKPRIERNLKDINRNF